jgi:hypothetical protein
VLQGAGDVLGTRVVHGLTDRSDPGRGSFAEYRCDAEIDGGRETPIEFDLSQAVRIARLARAEV